MDKLYIVIPAYNEEETIERVVEQWHPVAEKYGGQMLVVDDGSRDGTGAILKACEKKYPRLSVVRRRNGGHGAAVLYGYHYALAHHADYIFQTDSDGQTLPEEFAEFWKARRQCDLVIGQRCARADGWERIAVTKVLRLVIRCCFGVYVTDANTPFRLISAAALARYIDLIPEGFNLTNVLLSVIFVKKGCRVRWLPITFRARQGGKNSMNLKKIVKIGLHACRDFRKINRLL